MQNENRVICLKNKIEKETNNAVSPFRVSPVALGEARTFEILPPAQACKPAHCPVPVTCRVFSLTVCGESFSCGHQGLSAIAEAWCPGAPHRTPSSPPQ